MITMGDSDSDPIQSTMPADSPDKITKLFNTSAPIMIVKISAVVCAASRIASNMIRHVMRRRPTAKASAPMAPIPPASLGVNMPNEMPPRIRKNSAMTAQTLYSARQRSAQLLRSPGGQSAGRTRAIIAITPI
jgi:hypothetical protein